MKILLTGDCVGRPGRTILAEKLKGIRKDRGIDLVVSNIENASGGFSITQQAASFLFEAGVDVPKPYAMEKNAIVMDFIGDANTAAPILNSVNLSAHEAKNLFDRVIHNIDLMLANDCIHGDLSAYNILYWNGAITLIDFPQIVLPKSNPTAWNIFQRDVIRICDYFSAQGIHCDGRKIASELWTSRGYRIGKQADPKYLDPEDPADRKLWEKQQ